MKDKARETILGWNLDRVRKFLVNRWEYAAETADRLIMEYRRFMILSVEHPDVTIPVSDQVDEVWHAHLLFTEDYPAFCEAVAGEYLHHRVPEDEEQRLALASAYETNTINLYRNTFGEVDREAWGQNAQICWCETITRSKKQRLALEGVLA